jgi:hypothetical protein
MVERLEHRNTGKIIGDHFKNLNHSGNYIYHLCKCVTTLNFVPTVYSHISFDLEQARLFACFL